MANLFDERRIGRIYSQETADSIFSGAMTRLYGWVAMGVATTGVVGLIFAAAGILDGLGFLGFIVLLALWIGSLFVLRFAASRVPPAVLGVLYLAFTAIGGVLTSFIWVAYTGGIIVAAFLLTASVFGVMTVIGLTTKRDLTGLGTICIVGLVGVVVLGLVNIFIGSGFLSWLVTLVALPIFLGLTVYETKEVKELAQAAASEGDTRAASTIAIIGAVGLYLNFLNIFLILLRILHFFGGDD